MKTIKTEIMKKIVFLLLFSALVLFFATCDFNTDLPDEEQQITFIKTNPGGCNNQGEENAKRVFEENDIILFKVEKDTLDVFVGLKYICCAPFTTESKVLNDSIFITITDTCPVNEHSCYCKCMCYYTWDFLFSFTGDKKFWIKILLNDPREEQPIILKQDWIDLRN